MNPQNSSTVTADVPVGPVTSAPCLSTPRHGEGGGWLLATAIYFFQLGRLRWVLYHCEYDLFSGYMVKWHAHTYKHTHTRGYRQTIKTTFSVCDFSAETDLFRWDMGHYVCHPIIRSLGASGTHRGSDSIFRRWRLNQSLQDSETLQLQENELFFNFLFLKIPTFFLCFVFDNCILTHKPRPLLM